MTEEAKEMTDVSSCKTCRYFDSKDWGTEINNWCRYSDMPVINEGLCGHYDPIIGPCACPRCGSSLIIKTSCIPAGKVYVCKGCGWKKRIYEYDKGGKE